ncbi:MAG: VOC family protein [Bacteroidota bacterium]|nr:VOC family protein [Bacteroidota bacterium]MDP4232099.1 VOC family protein [Bacteroidota bacterium]MDP4241193.1 VOC family protein [Bacteroidota bacterium]MDP4286585.1 VOC family protein [Bacteroidota bacterium]
MQKINPFLWFNDNAVDAANVYTSAFKNAKTVSTMPGQAPTLGGKPMGVTVELAGTTFILFNGGPQYHPNPSISFYAMCETEEEVETLWSTLSKDGKIMMEMNAYPWSEKYGWTEDKFGVSWQIGLTRRTSRVVPTLMYNGAQQGKAEEAVKFYVSQFPSSSIDHVARYEPDEEGPTGQIKHAGFKLNDQIFAAMDSGHPMDVPFTPGISLFINCDTQEEVDRLWDKLGEGGRYDRCGWLQDKYGVSWQIIPTLLGKLMGDKDPKRAGNVMQAMLGMNKIDMKGLEEAYHKS